MSYKLICKDNSYPTQYFPDRKNARIWLHQHARNQINIQGYLRDKKDIGHDINLKKSDTYDLADYFDFILTRH